ncbi:hypothetical protein PG987_015493 [Apiospora arundinis]
MPPVRRNAKRATNATNAMNAMKASKAPKAIDAVIFGIDFGTTYSGLACGLTNQNGRSGQPRVDVIRDWPAETIYERDLQKVPTRLHYGDDDEGDMDDHLRNSEHIKKAQNMLNDLGKDATTVTADYCPSMSYSLCPLFGPESARNRMRRAAEKASIFDKRLGGVTTLELISEPEAAAIAVLYSDVDDCPDVAVGSKFIVGDCGGGTVDLISYEVVNTRRELKVKECTVGTGGLCGATFLDQAFYDYFLSIVPRDTWDKFDAHQKKAILDKGWEQNIKPGFDGKSGPYTIKLDPENRISFGKDPKSSISFGNGELSRIFKTVIDKIVQLFKDQIKDMDNKTQTTPEFIILVGGFGRNTFLYKCTEKEFGDDMEILQPQDNGPITSVCRGAVISGILQKSLVVPVLQRKARHSYGWAVREEWDPEKHTEGETEYTFDEARGMKMATGQFHWLVKAGDDVSSDVVPRPYELAYGMDKRGPVEYQSDVYKTLSPFPPKQLDDDDRSIQLVGTIAMQFPVPIESIPPRLNELGQRYRVLEYESYLEISGNAFNFRSVYDGKQVGELVIRSGNIQSSGGNADDSLFVEG